MKKIVIMIIALLCVGCTDQEKLSAAYFMHHPKLLKEEALHCQSLDNKTPDEVTFCDMVMSAATSFAAIIDEQQSSPEKFGQKIMDAEAACVKAQNPQDASCEDVKIYMAVMSLSSPG